jgi:hypothetical protein
VPYSKITVLTYKARELLGYFVRHLSSTQTTSSRNNLRTHQLTSVNFPLFALLRFKLQYQLNEYEKNLKLYLKQALKVIFDDEKTFPSEHLYLH